MKFYMSISISEKKLLSLRRIFKPIKMDDGPEHKTLKTTMA